MKSNKFKNCLKKNILKLICVKGFVGVYLKMISRFEIVRQWWVNFYKLQKLTISFIATLKLIIWEHIRGIVIASSIVLCTILFSKNNSFNKCNDPAILIGLGGAILALLIFTFTLTMIAVQKAADSWTPTITRLYKEDKKIDLAYYIIAFIGLSAFVFVKLDKENLTWLSFILFGIVLDIIRWNKNYICDLIAPSNAVMTLNKECTRLIDETDSFIKNSAKCAWRRRSNEEKANTIQYYEVDFNKSAPEYLKLRVNELADFAVKAIFNNDRLIASSAISTIGEMTKYILIKKQDNLGITHMPDLTFKSFYDEYFHFVYEALNAISQVAIDKKNEKHTLEILRAYTEISRSMIALNNDAILLITTSLVHFKNIVKKAADMKLDDVVWQSTNLLLNIPIYSNAANHQRHLIHDVSVRTDSIIESASYFIKKSFPLAGQIAIQIQIFLCNLANNQNLGLFIDNIDDTLKKILSMVFLEQDMKNNPIILNKINSFSLNLYNGKFLDFYKLIINQISIENNEESAGKIRNFLEMSKFLRLHFNELGQKYAFNEETFLSREAIKTILEDIKQILSEIKAKIPQGPTKLPTEGLGKLLEQYEPIIKMFSS